MEEIPESLTWSLPDSGNDFRHTFRSNWNLEIIYDHAHSQVRAAFTDDS